MLAIVKGNIWTFFLEFEELWEYTLYDPCVKDLWPVLNLHFLIFLHKFLCNQIKRGCRIYSLIGSKTAVQVRSISHIHFLKDPIICT